jgi:hypothetical protein
LGERSLSGLWYFLHGFSTALLIHDIRAERPLPADFHDWVAYRLGFYESTSGYRNMILKRVPDESAALDRFFELLDEHHSRRPRVVARVEGCDQEYKELNIRDGVREEVAKKFPSNLTLISYTDDLGFFVGADEEGIEFPHKGRFCPTLQSFGLRFGVRKENLRILEPDTFDRWLSQEDRFESSGSKGHK